MTERAGAQRASTDVVARLGGLDPVDVLEALDEGVLVQDPAGRILAVNEAAGRILGLPSDRLAGAGRSALEGPVLRADGSPMPVDEMPGRRAVRSGLPQLGVVVGLRRGEGAIVWVEVNSRPLVEDGEVVAVVSSVRDITDKRLLEHTIREAERRQRLLLEHAVGGYVIVADDGRIIDASASMFGSRPTATDDPWFPIDTLADLDRLHEEDRRIAARLMHDARANPGTPQRAELRARDALDREIWVELTATDHRDDDVIGGVVVNFSDITERKRAEQALAHEATHDVVTGLPNRRQLTARLDAALADDAGAGLVGVMFFDVDQFKLVNDSLGHPAGDELLVEVAARLRAGVSPQDVVSRFGGDEFVVMCTGVGSIEGVHAKAEGLLARFARPMVVDGSERTISLSGGVAVALPGTESADLLRAADTALNLAKERGRARVELFTEEIRDRAVRRMALETDLRGAQGAGHLHLVYQPILDVGTEAVAGCEALVRWHHPDLGAVGPDEFIAVAEKAGLIAPIGDWVIEQAVAQLRRWRDAGVGPDDFWVSVNVSAVQLAEPGFVAAVAAALAAAGVDASRLHLEITESVLMEDDRASIDQLEELRSLGVHLNVDDFGTGYSSLAYLKRLPIHALKIDRSFIGGLGTDPHDTSIVRAIVGLAQALDLELVAEGVETAVQLDALRGLGCDRAQGYHWVGPLAPDDLSDWLATFRP